MSAVSVTVEAKMATSNLEPVCIEEALTPRTLATILVCFYGQPCRVPAIMKLTGRYGLLMIKSNAQAQVLTITEQRTGSSGVVSGTISYPINSLGATSDSKAITTGDATVAKQLRQLCNYSLARKFEHKILSYNSRLDEV